jgi:membrane fusion protein, multidrug efflux system
MTEISGQSTDPDQETDITSPKRTRRGQFLRRWWIVLPIVCLIAAALLVLPIGRSIGSKKKTTASTAGMPVVAAAAIKKDVNIYIPGLGTVTPLNTVTVRTRVDGELTEVVFREGQIVKNGELLARIDSRPFEVQLAQAEGQLERDKALLSNARLDLDRYKILWAQNSIPKQQLDTQESVVSQYEGAVMTDRGLIDSARLQLIYCRITSPLSGRVGLRLVDPGNIVHAADTNGIVVITQLQPIAVLFSIPQDNLPQLLARMKAGASLPVEVYDRDLTRLLATGHLLTVDNQIDPNTGTVRIKAVFPNEDNGLFPNQFVNAKLLINVIRNAVVIPTSAVQRGPQGAFAYVINANQTVSMRPVSLGETQGGETVVTAGISPGEIVVMEGAEKLREGARVEVKGRKGGAARRGGS